MRINQREPNPLEPLSKEMRWVYGAVAGVLGIVFGLGFVLKIYVEQVAFLGIRPADSFLIASIRLFFIPGFFASVFLYWGYHRAEEGVIAAGSGIVTLPFIFFN
jgi:hypothetical protein